MPSSRIALVATTRPGKGKVGCHLSGRCQPNNQLGARSMELLSDQHGVWAADGSWDDAVASPPSPAQTSSCESTPRKETGAQSPVR